MSSPTGHLLPPAKVLTLLCALMTGVIGCGQDLSELGSGIASPVLGRDSSASGEFGTSIAFAEQPQFRLRPTELQYQLGVTSRFIYTFETTLKLPNKDSVLRGSISYLVLNSDASYVLQEDESAQQTQSTGSGFVVRPDGFLVTCAHVVKGATAIEVRLGAQTYSAKVVDIDSKNDLALIRIDATELTPLPLMDSDQVELAEEVRVVGYPLTDVLGESLKVARGTVSGINTTQPNRAFQLDASVNPGNSGGPVVNEKGHLAGVASSLLSGNGMSNVGFAIPANQVRQLLERQELRYRNADPGASYLRGPDLAKRVTSSVALLKVTTGPNGVGIAEDKVIRFSGGLVPHTRQNGEFFRNGGEEHRNDTGNLLINPFGEVSYNNGKEYLPTFVRSFATIGLERLPDDDSDEWQVTEVRVIPQKKESHLVVEEDPLFAEIFRMTPGLPGRYRFGLDPKVKEVASYELHPAIEQTNYKIVTRRGDEVEIAKTYDLATVHQDNRTPFLHLHGSATLKFDKKIGRLKSVEYDGVADFSIDGELTSLPMSYICTLKENYPPRKPEVKRPDPVPTTERLPKTQGLSKLDLSS